MKFGPLTNLHKISGLFVYNRTQYRYQTRLRPIFTPRTRRYAMATTPKSAKKTTAAPSLRFFHSEELRIQTLKVLDAIDTAPDHPKHGQTLADLVSDLVDAGMDYYFLRALKAANVGFVAEQSAKLGMSGAVKLISSVSRKYLERMEPQQLQIVAQHLRTLT